jgi:hypothetical protein
VSSHGVGGVVVGELSPFPPMVFCLPWPADISADLVTFDNPRGCINNSELEMAGLLLLQLCLEGVAPDMVHKHVALFSDNLPTVKSRVAAQLVRALAFRINLKQACPLTPVHIPGTKNALTDITLCSFGSVPEWHCCLDDALLTLFNETFPLPEQASWTCFQFNTNVTTRVISVLRMKGITLAEWQRLPKICRHIRTIGRHMSGLWDWTLIYRGCSTRQEFVSSLDLQRGSGTDTMDGDSKLQLARSLALSQPLARRSCWPVETTQPK